MRKCSCMEDAGYTHALGDCDGILRTTEHVKCLLCLSGGQTVLKKMEESGEAVWLVRCDCGLAFLNPRLSERETNAAYESNSLKQAEYYTEGTEDDRKTFQDRLNLVSKYMNEGKSVIDIGASVGTFLNECYFYGFDKLYGVELNEASRKKAKESYGITLTKDLPDDAKADLINMSDIIEHLRNPLEFLIKLRPHLNERGILLITTPDFDRWITHLVNIKPVEHLYYFNKATMNKLLDKAGYEVLYLGNTTRFRRFRHLVQSTNVENPLIKAVLKAIIALKLDAMAEAIFFKNLNNDILCIATKKEMPPMEEDWWDLI